MNSVRFWREENECEKLDSGKFPYPVTRDHGTVSELSQLRSVTLPLARINDRSVNAKVNKRPYIWRVVVEGGFHYWAHTISELNATRL